MYIFFLLDKEEIRIIFGIELVVVEMRLGVRVFEEEILLY